MSTHKTLRGAEGPKTGMFAIFGQVLKDPKTGILTMVENCTGGKVQKWFLQNVGSFVKRITFIQSSIYLLSVTDYSCPVWIKLKKISELLFCVLNKTFLSLRFWPVSKGNRNRKTNTNL